MHWLLQLKEGFHFQSTRSILENLRSELVSMLLVDIWTEFKLADIEILKLCSFLSFLGLSKQWKVSLRLHICWSSRWSKEKMSLRSMVLWLHNQFFSTWVYRHGQVNVFRMLWKEGYAACWKEVLVDLYNLRRMFFFKLCITTLFELCKMVLWLKYESHYIPVDFYIIFLHLTHP